MLNTHAIMPLASVQNKNKGAVAAPRNAFHSNLPSNVAAVPDFQVFAFAFVIMFVVVLLVLLVILVLLVLHVSSCSSCCCSCRCSCSYRCCDK